MGLEKNGSKSGGGYVGGFLQLFDWNGKSRKRLSYNKFDLPEGNKQGKRSDDNLPSTRLCMTYGDENGGFSSAKGSTDYSCASSSTDDEGNGIKAPGVVARLMGLDSLPTSNVNEPYSIPFFEPQSHRDAHYQRKTSQFYSEYQVAMSENQPYTDDGFHKRTAESKPQKVPNSPIERFQRETLPLRKAKPHPITHHKLLSPIKSPGFISPKNVAVIMEAAARILEPGYQAGSKGKSPSFGSSSVYTKALNLKENSITSQRPIRLSEASKNSVESSAAKCLKGQSLNKSWNGSDDTPSYRTSPNSEDNHSVGSKNKGKSISLAIQAKVNVQRREGLSSSSKSLLVQKEEDEYKSKQSLKKQHTAPKNRQNKSSISNASGVLRQNNQKQNCPTNKDKSLKPSVSNQQGKKVVSGDGSLRRINASNKLTGCSRVGKKAVSEMAGLEKEVPSSRTKNFPRKKRAINGDLYSEKSGFIDTMSVDTDVKSFQPHTAINEHLNQGEDGRKQGVDVVSFTFTSPMRKPTTTSRSSGHMVEKQNPKNVCSVDQNCHSDAKGKKLLSLGLNVIGGDALSILLEQKLRELTSGGESSSCIDSGKTEMISTFAPNIQDLASPLSAAGSIPREAKKYLFGHQKDEFLGGFSYGCSSINGQVLKVNSKFQEAERMFERCSSDPRKELDFQHPSPVSIFETPFFNETSNSSESWGSTNGNKMSSSVQAQSLVGTICLENIPSAAAETDLSDSASSMFKGTVDREHVVGLGVSDQMKTDKQELEYLRKVLQNTDLIFKELPLNYVNDIINPLVFDKLENQKIEWINEGDVKDCKLSRKELFDCVREFVGIKCGCYNRGGYRKWAQGVLVVQKEGLAEEIYKEILLWRSMGDWMVDDLVERDMSNHLGRWLCFEREAFEIGEEIQKDILCSLVDEVVADIFG